MQFSVFLEKTLERLEDFFIRSLLPITIFFFQFFMIDLLLFDKKYLVEILDFVHTYEDYRGVGWGVFALLLGFGFFVRIFQEIPDWMNKGDYIRCFTGKGADFGRIREKVKTRLCQDNRIKPELDCVTIDRLKDYELYLVISQLVQGNSKKYVDEVRVIYMTFFSLFLNTWLFLYLEYGLKWFVPLLACLVGAFLFLASVYLARERYISRNIRLYFNYLMQKG